VMKYSKNVQAAKEFLKHIHSKEQFGKWFEIDYGFNVGSTAYWESHPLWNTIDDAMKPYRYTGRGTRMIGHAGPANARAGEIYSKYVITDMFAKAVQGMKPEGAVAWAEGELKRVYES
jgi:multiple sugar transport system substrate-binding protein